MQKNDTFFLIPDGVMYICSYAFFDCVNLTSVVIPDGVTYIEYGAFDCCENLEKITIPNSVIVIECDAFRDCTNLNDVYYTGSQNNWEGIRLYEQQNSELTSATIHYNSIPANGNMLQMIEVNDTTVTLRVKNISDTDYNSVVLLVGVYNESDCLCNMKTVTINDFVSGYTDSGINVTFDSIPRRRMRKSISLEVYVYNGAALLRQKNQRIKITAPYVLWGTYGVVVFFSHVF